MDDPPAHDVTRGAGPRAARWPKGLSHLEMMLVVTLILIIASIATPFFRTAVVRAREAVLADHLYTLRYLIDRFTVDNGRSPMHLEELVEKGYLGRLPTDPFTGSNEIRRLTEWKCRKRLLPRRRKSIWGL